jgi:hypothetical protein
MQTRNTSRSFYDRMSAILIDMEGQLWGLPNGRNCRKVNLFGVTCLAPFPLLHHFQIAEVLSSPPSSLSSRTVVPP